MKACGVVCEFDPFHRGHAWLLAEARRLTGADAIICALSGGAAQRGQFTRYDKFLRARLALAGGADLVLENPARFACQAAPDFAAGGVGALLSTGLLTHLAFGCEPEALPFLATAARLLAEEPPAFRQALRRELDAGAGYPAARSAALAEALGREAAAALAAPNASLAMEYMRRLPEGVQAVPIPRRGASHGSEAMGPLASAGAIRAAMRRGESEAALSALPFPELILEAEVAGNVHAPDALDATLLYRLRAAEPEALAVIYGMDEGLEHRLIRAARQAGTREELLTLAGTKRYTRARLARAATNALLGLTKDVALSCKAPTYLRILGFRKTATPLLREIDARGTLPRIAKPADWDKNDPLFALDVRVQDLWALGAVNSQARAAGADFTHGMIVI